MSSWKYRSIWSCENAATSFYSTPKKWHHPKNKSRLRHSSIESRCLFPAKKKRGEKQNGKVQGLVEKFQKYQNISQKKETEFFNRKSFRSLKKNGWKRTTPSNQIPFRRRLLNRAKISKKKLFFSTKFKAKEASVTFLSFFLINK